MKKILIVILTSVIIFGASYFISYHIFIKVDNNIVTGHIVITTIDMRASRGLHVIVRTKRNPLGKLYKGQTYNPSSIFDLDYIEPTGNFKMVLKEKKDGFIDTITFNQI